MNEKNQAPARLFDIFLDPFLKRKKVLKENKVRLVHYTSATTGMFILNSGKMWMRNVAGMNDYREVYYGRNLFWSLADDVEQDKGLPSNLSSVFAFTDSQNIVQFISNIIMERAENKRWDSYITCFSEHEVSEDNYGRLSMWRGYGKDGGVAFVFDTEAFLEFDKHYMIITVPVEYLDKKSFKCKMEEWIDIMEENRTFIDGFWKSDPYNFMKIFNYFLDVILLSIKHPGFKEEREWRFVSSDFFGVHSELHEDIENKGYPQIVRKLPLSLGKNISIDKILDRIIIGPNPHAEQVYLAYVNKLAQLGFSHPEEKVIQSSIPYRAW